MHVIALKGTIRKRAVDAQEGKKDEDINQPRFVPEAHIAQRGGIVIVPGHVIQSVRKQINYRANGNEPTLEKNECDIHKKNKGMFKRIRPMTNVCPARRVVSNIRVHQS